MATRVSTFTNATLYGLTSAATWNGWVDSWNAWLTFFGFSGAALLSHVAAGDPAIPRAAIVLLQQNVATQCPLMLQDVAPTSGTNFWPAHTLATARAAAGLSGSDWTRYWFRQITGTGGGVTTYVDGDALVTGELAYNRSDSRVYLRGASSWTLQARNTFPTVKQAFGQARQYDIIGSHLVNELAAVHQQLYYQGATFGGTWVDDGCKSGNSPGDFPPFTFADTTAAAAESHADANWSTATATTSGNSGGTDAGGAGAESGAETFVDLENAWTDSSHNWWQAWRFTRPRRYGGNHASGTGTRLASAVIELWTQLIKPGVANPLMTGDVMEYEGPYAENSIQQLGTHTIASGETSVTFHVDLGSASSWPSVTAQPYNGRQWGRRGCSTFRTQARTDVRGALPAP